MILNNFLLLIPLFAILGGVGLSFDSAFAADYVLDESFCENQMNGSWNNAVSPRLGGTCIAEEYGLESGNTLEIPFHVELRMDSTQPTLGISSGATLNIAGELRIEQDTDDSSWQGSSAIANFGTINALDYSEVIILPDRDSIFNFGTITIRGDSEYLEYGLTSNSSGSLINHNDDLPNDRVEFFGQETLDQSTCEDVMQAEWNSNTCIMYHWVVFKSGSELTIPSGVTWKLPPSDGGYNVSVDNGATIINDGTIIIDTGKPYPFYNQGTFINNGDYLIHVSSFAGLYSNGTVENYGTISSSEQNRFYALWVADGSFTNYGTIDVPDYLINNAYRITESDIPDTALDLDSDGYSDAVDCNDFDNNTYPGATELADGLDNNCDGVIPNSELDLDNDGYIESNFDSYIWQGSMSVMGGNDCHDGDNTVYPGASETVIGLDQNCDGYFLIDADNDGYASIESGGNDCDDGDATTYPGASETDPNIDSNCDGSFIEDIVIVDSVDTSSLVDADGDGYASIESGGNDCNDYNQTIYPGAIENWVGVDSNCDTIAAELVLIDAEFCQDMALTSNRVQWSESDQTCIMTENIELDDSNKVYQTDHTSLILHFKDASGGLAEGSTLRVYAPVILENTLFVNLGNVEVDSSFKIDENSVFYNVGEPITISYQGQSIEFEGSGKLNAVFDSTTIDVKGQIKNNNLIKNWGTFDVDMCTGSIENLIGGVFENGDTGIINQIECNIQPTNPGVDITPPVINVPENTQLEVETAGSLVTQFFRATAIDETDGNVTVNCNFPQGNQYRVGTTIVTCTAIDDAGNDSQKSFSVTVVVVDDDAIVCGEGTELFAGECRPIPQRQDPTVDVPELLTPEVQQTQTTIDLIATVTDTFENGVTTLDIKFNKNFVNYEIDVTQNGDRLLKETSHAMGTTVTYEIEGEGSVENPIDVKITSLGIGLPGQEDKWTGPTGVITTVQVVPEFGTIAMMILVVAIVSVVAITSKSRLMTKI